MQNKIKANLLLLTVIALISINSVKAIEPPGSTGSSYDSLYCSELRDEIKNVEKELKGYLTDLVNSITSFMNGSISWEKYLGDQRDLNSSISRTNNKLRDLKRIYDERCDLGPIIPPITPSPTVSSPTPAQPTTPSLAPPLPTTPMPISSPVP